MIATETIPILPKNTENKKHVTLFVFYFIGVSSMLGWRYFLTAYDYWIYKFRDITANATNNEKTPLQKEFTALLTISATIPVAITSLVNVFIAKHVSIHSRMVVTLIALLITFVITTILVLVDTDTWQNAFFNVTIITVIIVNVFATILMGTMFGIISKFPPIYITAYTSGQATSGIFTSVSQIISLAVGVSSIDAAYIYFIVGDVTLLFSLFCYIYIYKRSAYYRNRMSTNVQTDVATQVSGLRVLWTAWPFGVSLFLDFLFTWGVFPGVMVLVEPEDGNSVWGKKYFVPTVIYLLDAVGDFIGRMAALMIQKPMSGTCQIIWCAMRVIFIPLYFMCNLNSKKNPFPIIFHKDYMYGIIMLIFSFTYGYFANLAAIGIPRSVRKGEKEYAGYIYTVFLGLGLISGSTLEYLIVNSLEK